MYITLNDMMEGHTSERPASMMSFMDAVKSGLTKSITVSGRASRSEYWWFVLFGQIFFFTCAVLAGVTEMGVLALLPILLLPAAITLLIRRLHDVGKSGLFLILFMIPLVNFVVMILWLVVDAGQPQANDYGDVPTNELE